MVKICRLKVYDHKENLLFTKTYGSIYTAVQAGYIEEKDFNVIEQEGENKKLYWAGKKEDKKRLDFHKWKEIAENKDNN